MMKQVEIEKKDEEGKLEFQINFLKNTSKIRRHPDGCRQSGRQDGRKDIDQRDGKTGGRDNVSRRAEIDFSGPSLFGLSCTPNPSSFSIRCPTGSIKSSPVFTCRSATFGAV